MSTVAPEVQEAHDLLQGRLKTLDAEREKIVVAIDSLSLNGSTTRPGGRPRPVARPGRVPKAPSAKRPSKRGGNNRAAQAVKLIEKNPGISASDIAKAMKIKPNYLYRVLGDLTKEGLITKQGRSYSPVKQAATK